jgi:hypothetical protein
MSDEWDLWYQDSFELRSPRRIECSGRGLVEGLLELWARHLYETVQPNGLTGFAKFDLWLKQEWWLVLISGDEDGQVKLRQWVYGEGKPSSDYLESADRSLLVAIAETHAKLIENDLDCEDIIEGAEKSQTKDDFLAALKLLRESVD